MLGKFMDERAGLEACLWARAKPFDTSIQLMASKLRTGMHKSYSGRSFTVAAMA